MCCTKPYCYKLCYLTKCGLFCIFNRQLKKAKSGKKPVHPHCEYMPEKVTKKYVYGGFEVIPLPYCFDNLSYIVMDVETKEFILVDPGDYDFISTTLK